MGFSTDMRGTNIKIRSAKALQVRSHHIRVCNGKKEKLKEKKEKYTRTYILLHLLLHILLHLLLRLLMYILNLHTDLTTLCL
jgi:hypothetical protein